MQRCSLSTTIYLPVPRFSSCATICKVFTLLSLDFASSTKHVDTHDLSVSQWSMLKPQKFCTNVATVSGCVLMCNAHSGVFLYRI